MNQYRVDPLEIQTFPYRGALTSDDLNRRIIQLRQSVLRAILRGQQTRAYVHEVNLAALYTNALVTAEHNALLKQLNAIRTSGSTKTIHVSFYEDKDPSVPPDVNILRDRLYGQISLAETAKWDKIPTAMNAFGDTLPLDTVSITRDGATLDRDHPLFWSINGEIDRFWIDDTADLGQQTVIEYAMPAGIRSEINSLAVVPFPYRACRIVGLDYKAPQGFRSAPGFVETVDPIRVHFVPGSFDNTVRLTLQASVVTFGTELRSLFGLAHVEMALTDYASSGTAYMKMAALGSDTFNRITTFNADFFVDSAVPASEHTNPPVQFTIVQTDGSTVYSSVSNKYPLAKGDTPIAVTGSPTTLWLKVDLREPIDRVSPIVRGATVTYE